MEPRPVKRPPPSVEAVRENERATKRRPATSGACFYSLTIQNSVIHSVKKEILPLDSFISAHTGSDLTETPSSASSLQPWPIDRNKFTQPTHVVWIGKTELSQDHKLLQLSPSTSVVGREFDVGETEIDCSMVMDQHSVPSLFCTGQLLPQTSLSSPDNSDKSSIPVAGGLRLRPINASVREDVKNCASYTDPKPFIPASCPQGRPSRSYDSSSVPVAQSLPNPKIANVAHTIAALENKVDGLDQLVAKLLSKRPPPGVDDSRNHGLAGSMIQPSSNTARNTQKPDIVAQVPTKADACEGQSNMRAVVLGLKNKSGESLNTLSDPSHLCPFCETLLPFGETSDLVSIRERLEGEKMVSRNRNHWNPHALTPKHQIVMHREYCRIHATHEQLVLRRNRGWPEALDFLSLTDRLIRLVSNLQIFLRVIANYHLDTWSETLCVGEYPAWGSYDEGDATITRIFHDVRVLFSTRKGKARAVESRYISYDQTGAGYYGDLGYKIVWNFLRLIFCADSVNISCYAPVPFDALLDEVLLPEVAIRLIQEDLSVSREAAVNVWYESNRMRSVIYHADDVADKIIEELKVCVLRGDLTRQEG